MRESRILTVEDAEVLSNIYSEIEAWRSPHQPKEKFEYWKNLDNVRRTLSDTNATYVGTFENGILIGALRMSWWKSMPHWSLGNIVTNIRTLRFNLDKNGIGDAMKMAIQIAEAKDCYRFYTAISQRQLNQELFNMWPKFVPELRDYLYVVEFEFDGTGSTGYPAFDILIDSARLPEPYVSKYYIRSATANNTRRKIKGLNNGN